MVRPRKRTIDDFLDSPQTDQVGGIFINLQSQIHNEYNISKRDLICQVYGKSDAVETELIFGPYYPEDKRHISYKKNYTISNINYIVKRIFEAYKGSKFMKDIRITQDEKKQLIRVHYRCPT